MRMIFPTITVVRLGRTLHATNLQHRSILGNGVDAMGVLRHYELHEGSNALLDLIRWEP